MPPKKEITKEKITFINVAYNYVKSKGLHLKEVVPFLFQAHFNLNLSYSTLIKYLNNEAIDNDIQIELKTKSNLYT